MARVSVLPGRPTGELKVLSRIVIPGVQGERHVRIYLPRGYEPEHAHRALYLFDGQNMFDDAPSFAGGWHIDEAIDKLATKTRRAPVVVAIDHGGDKRIAELSPFGTPPQGGQLDALLDGIVGTLMPLVSQHAHIGMGPLYHAIGGSSLGGLAAFYTHFRRPDVFGGAIAMSPSFWLERRAIFDWVRNQPTPKISRVYLDCGAREGRGAMLALAERMAQHLRERNYGPENLMWIADPNGGHREADWRRRAPRALRFMYREPNARR